MKSLPTVALATALVLAVHPACTAAAPAGRATPAPQATAGAQGLGAGIQAAVAAAGLRNSLISISVRDVGTGALVADIEGSRLMTPASNMKVLTTAAALRVLGADYCYATRLVRSGDRLSVIGDGDPSLGDPEMADVNTVTDETGTRRSGLGTEAMVDLWVSAAKRAGITQVKELVVDDRVFDREFQHPGWPADQLSNSYCAEIAGLNFHVGLLQAKLNTAGGRVAVNALWPRTVIDTSAVRNLLGGEGVAGQGRTPEIMADAAYAIFNRPKSYTGNFAIDEDVLRAEGVTDLEPYAVTPGAELLPDFFV